MACVPRAAPPVFSAQRISAQLRLRYLTVTPTMVGFVRETAYTFIYSYNAVNMVSFSLLQSRAGFAATNRELQLLPHIDESQQLLLLAAHGAFGCNSPQNEIHSAAILRCVPVASADFL
ncbi:MAG: hypothetical protein LUB58_02010 [Oscillospiraceae bacterium]|nr:hypothetical protein [Oscillospiraceae bacterium]